MNQFRLVPVIDFAAEIADIDIDNIGTAGIVIVPDMLFQLVAGQHDSFILHHVAEQGELFPGETDFRIPAEYLMGIQKDLQICSLKTAGWSLGRFA